MKITYTILLVLLNILEFKKLEKISSDNLFYILTIDVLSISLYMFLYVYRQMDISLINVVSMLLVIYFYIKEKCSFIKTTFLIINIIFLINILI